MKKKKTVVVHKQEMQHDFSEECMGNNNSKVSAAEEIIVPNPSSVRETNDLFHGGAASDDEIQTATWELERSHSPDNINNTGTSMTFPTIVDMPESFITTTKATSRLPAATTSPHHVVPKFRLGTTAHAVKNSPARRQSRKAASSSSSSLLLAPLQPDQVDHFVGGRPVHKS